MIFAIFSRGGGARCDVLGGAREAARRAPLVEVRHTSLKYSCNVEKMSTRAARFFNVANY